MRDAFGVERPDLLISKKWKREYENAALAGGGLASTIGGTAAATHGVNQILASTGSRPGWTYTDLKLAGKKNLVRGGALIGAGGLAIAAANKRSKKKS